MICMETIRDNVTEAAARGTTNAEGLRNDVWCAW